jgi:prepilin-type N-terminal cleavage/methylation domain-containing protein
MSLLSKVFYTGIHFASHQSVPGGVQGKKGSKKMSKSNQQGFTLVEIAIVLVIIGLLLGGILKGQEMITQAKIKNVMADYSGISAAYHGYQDRYRAIPGDDGGATRWTSPAGVVAGNANGVVHGTYNQGCSAPGTTVGENESCFFWDHLRRAGFVSGSGTLQPFNSLTGLIGVQTGNGAAAVDGTGVGPVLGGAAGVGGFTGLIICSANLPDKIAIAVDTQMDDGSRTGGNVRGQLQATPNPNAEVSAIAAGAGGVNNYQENGTNVYALCRSL